MWNIQTTALATGASIVCHDGSSIHPTPARLWQVVADERVTFQARVGRGCWEVPAGTDPTSRATYAAACGQRVAVTFAGVHRRSI